MTSRLLGSYAHSEVWEGRSATRVGSFLGSHLTFLGSEVGIRKAQTLGVGLNSLQTSRRHIWCRPLASGHMWIYEAQLCSLFCLLF